MFMFMKLMGCLNRSWIDERSALPKIRSLIHDMCCFSTLLQFSNLAIDVSGLHGLRRTEMTVLTEESLSRSLCFSGQRPVR